MFLLTALMLFDDCPSSRTLQITDSPLFTQHTETLTGRNQYVCINLTVPHIALSLLQSPNALIEVFSAGDSTYELDFSTVAHQSFARIFDFGDDRGFLVFRSLSATRLIFSTVHYPPACSTRVTSTLVSDVFEVNSDCSGDGCVPPGSSICYFNGLAGQLIYDIDVDLSTNLSAVDIYAENGILEHFSGRSSRELRVENPVLVVVQNDDPGADLSQFASIRVNETNPVRTDGARGRWDGDETGLAVFSTDGELTKTTPAAAFFGIAAVLSLVLVLAAIAALVLNWFEYRNEREVREPAPIVDAPESSLPIEPVKRQMTPSLVDDGNPECLPSEV
jgi:hypothetical protein